MVIITVIITIITAAGKSTTFACGVHGYAGPCFIFELNFERT
jgi:hypothetical protein